MQKLLIIALKDLKLIFRDPAALILMLLAPFLITLGMGLVTGRFSGNASSGISSMTVAIVNQDEGELGKALEAVFKSEDLADLVVPTLPTTPDEAHRSLEADEVSAAIIIPQGFSSSIIPDEQGNISGEPIQIAFIANPNSPTNAGILRSILDAFLTQVEVGRIGAEITLSQIAQTGKLTPQLAAQLGEALGSQLAQQSAQAQPIQLENTTASGAAVKFDLLMYFAPGMALMFLMFAVTQGGRSLLLENRTGTLPRMLQTPTTSAQILGGNVLGIFLTAVAQLTILIGGTSLLFSLDWGEPLGVVLLILAAAFAASGWGSFIATLFKTPAQVSNFGSVIMLIFGLLGGSFFDMSLLPEWVSVLSKITPNAWGLRGFTTLAGGGALGSIGEPLLALVLMGIILFVAASIWMRRRGLTGM
ncbi:MAG: ABC transporter permease [Anaerolineaceae bacterium]|jgi:ABC-2 type transport system permease protein|nr:ABC transporter permease [Anaerolineaceae bacterium]